MSVVWPGKRCRSLQRAAVLTPIPENSGGTTSMDSQESGCAIC